MERKFKASEQPLTTKIIYGIVITILVASAVVVGIVAANNRKKPAPEVPPPAEEIPDQPDKPDNPEPEKPDDGKKDEDKADTFTSPTVGKISIGHSLTVPVFSDTLREWRMHTGIDITTEDRATVYTAAAGEVKKIYNDPLMGMTVEIAHKNDIVTVYQNLDKTLAAGVKVGAKLEAGAKIGQVGDTSVKELAQEPHLHFSLLVKGVSVNPLDYISKESQKVSLGITEEKTA